TGDEAEELARWLTNLLAVAQVAGVVVHRPNRQRMPRLDGTQLHEKLADVAHLAGQHFGGRRRRGIVQQMAIILEHGPAAGGIDDDGINGLQALQTVTKSSAVDRGELLGRLLARSMVVQGPTTDLRTWDPYLAAIALEYAGRGPVGLWEKCIGGAAGKQ